MEPRVKDIEDRTQRFSTRREAIVYVKGKKLFSVSILNEFTHISAYSTVPNARSNYSIISSHMVSVGIFHDPNNLLITPVTSQMCGEV